MDFIFKKFISAALILCMIFQLVVFFSCVKTPEPHIYIALGDSIPSGYGLDSPEEGYPALFYEMLKNDEYVDEYKNMATSGYTTTMLLEFLNGMDTEDTDFIQNARIVTLNIGGNNILSPFLKYLEDMDIISGTDDFKSGAEETWDVIMGIIAGVEGIISESENTKFTFGDILSGAWNMLTGLGNMLIGGVKILLGIPDAVSTFTGSFSDELKKELDDGVQTFSDEFIEIIAWIEIHAPKATIIVNTVYNPIPQKIQGISVDFSDAANAYIKSMNDIIIAESEKNGYLVIDVYAFLTNQTDMMNLNLDPLVGDISFDIHPNAEGHKSIAQLNFDSFMQNESIVKNS